MEFESFMQSEDKIQSSKDSALTKRFSKDPSFERTNMVIERFSLASEVASSFAFLRKNSWCPNLTVVYEKGYKNKVLGLKIDE